MDRDGLHQTHDKLFKATFSDPLAAGAFLRGHLAEAVSLGVDWTTLQFHPGVLSTNG